MDTKITKSNAKSAIKDDKAHIDYLKRDVLDDQKYGGKNKDINQTADEKHITNLARDVKDDERKEFSRDLKKNKRTTKWFRNGLNRDLQCNI